MRPTLRHQNQKKDRAVDPEPSGSGRALEVCIFLDMSHPFTQQVSFTVH
jgi:hypothetical protein